jgi:hypothetical protein
MDSSSNAYCEKCEIENLPGKFCGDCGTALKVREDLCTSCGSPRKTGKFCDQCGNPFVKVCKVCGEASPKNPICDSCQSSDSNEASQPIFQNLTDTGDSRSLRATKPVDPGVSPKRNTIALVGFGFGIASLFAFEFGILWLLAIVISLFGLREARALKSQGIAKHNTGFAITGLVLGLVYMVVWFAWNSGYMNGYVG